MRGRYRLEAEARAEWAAKRVGLAVRRHRSTFGGIHYEVIEPLSKEVVHSFLIMPTDVVEFCAEFSRLRRH